ACVYSARRCQSPCSLQDAQRAAPPRSGKETYRAHRILASQNRNLSRRGWAREKAGARPRWPAISARFGRTDMVYGGRYSLQVNQVNQVKSGNQEKKLEFTLLFRFP